MTTADLLEHESGGGTPGEELIAVGYTVNTSEFKGP